MKNTKFKRVKSKFVEETKAVFKFWQKDHDKWQAIFANAVLLLTRPARVRHEVVEVIVLLKKFSDKTWCSVTNTL